MTDEVLPKARQKLRGVELFAGLNSSASAYGLGTFPFREGIGKDANLPAPPKPSLKGKVASSVSEMTEESSEASRSKVVLPVCVNP